MLKNIFMLMVVQCLWASVYAQEFVITKKIAQENARKSRTKLKEELGCAARDAFHASRSLMAHIGKSNVTIAGLREKSLTAGDQLGAVAYPASLQKALGSLQVDIAKIQKTFSKTLESLLDNRAPFKRVRRADLSKAHGVMHDVASSLEQHKLAIKNLHHALLLLIKEPILPVKDDQKVLDQKSDVKGGAGDDQEKRNQQKRQAIDHLNSALQKIAQNTTHLKKMLKDDNCLKRV